MINYLLILVRVRLGFPSPLFDIDRRENRHGKPDHEDEEGKSPADVACFVCDETDY
jgi:hypothetical protein